MTKLLVLLLSAFFLVSCASPYQPQAQALQQAYINGEISTNDYHARLTELQALDLRRRQMIIQSFQNQQYLYQMRQPRTYYLYPR